MPAKTREKLAVVEAVEPLIRQIRARRIILDSDLARLYRVETKALNRAVKRNFEKFPSDFMFRLTAAETRLLRCQIGTPNPRRGGRRYLPYAFTEHGAIMAANILNSPRAVQMSVFVVRAFIKMRGVLTDTHTLARKLAKLEAELKSRLDVHEAAIVDVLQRIMRILAPTPQPPPPRREIGFHVKEAGDTAARGRARG